MLGAVGRKVRQMKGKQGGRYYWTQMPSKTKRNIGISVQIEKGRKKSNSRVGAGVGSEEGDTSCGCELRFRRLINFKL